MADPTYIAVVDDDTSVRVSLARLLRLARFEAIGFASAESFLADTRRARFGCLVLDVRLGGMSGIELLARLAAERAPPPVIFVTAVDEARTRARAEALGCAGYFSKCAPGSGIIEAIRRAAASASRPSC